MGAKVGGDKGGPMADINVTPLVDVVLVLLIIFMVITPMLSSGIDVKLPESTTATTTQDVGQHLVISIREDGVPFVDTEKSSLDALVDDPALPTPVRQQNLSNKLTKEKQLRLREREIETLAAEMLAENGEVNGTDKD